jgi:hypothetical protein
LPTREQAEAWVKASWEALDAGLPAVDPTPYQQPAAPSRVSDEDDPLFEVLARQWWDETYEEFCKAGPDRASEVRRDIELHILPTFGALHISALEPRKGGAARKLVKQWTKTLAGRPVDAPTATGRTDLPPRTKLVTIPEASALTFDPSDPKTPARDLRSSIMRARKNGKLPGSFVEEGPHGRLLIPSAI